jgi:hypothetical protein
VSSPCWDLLRGRYHHAPCLVSYLCYCEGRGVARSRQGESPRRGIFSLSQASSSGTPSLSEDALSSSVPTLLNTLVGRPNQPSKPCLQISIRHACVLCDYFSTEGRVKTQEKYLLLRAADRYAYTGCGSTAYCYLFYLGDEQILIHIAKCCRSSA